jgi:hypothetical protein
MELFIIIEDSDRTSAPPPGTWVLGASEEAVLMEAFWRPHERKDYFIECDADHWHRFHEVEYIHDFDGYLEERLIYYRGACTSAAAYVEHSEELTELHQRLLEADKHARGLGLDIQEHVDLDGLPTYGSDVPADPSEHRVWSWDDTHLLVGDGDDVSAWRIIPRQGGP